MPDQQLNSRLGVKQPSSVRPQSRNEVFEAGSVSVIPSTRSTIR